MVYDSGFVCDFLSTEWLELYALYRKCEKKCTAKYMTLFGTSKNLFDLKLCNSLVVLDAFALIRSENEVRFTKRSLAFVLEEQERTIKSALGFCVQ